MSKRDWREAEVLGERGRWEQAGAAWGAIVDKARRVRDTRLVREAATRAADAFRRDDRPAASAKMLMYAREAGKDDATDAAQLAAALLDAGQVDAAADIAADALAKASDPVSETIAVDTLIGLSLTRGDIDGARALLDRLAALGLPGAQLSRRFRLAQVDRLDGLVRRAEQEWATLAEELAEHPAAAGPTGAALSELGEIELLRGALSEDPREACARAVIRFEAAGAAWARAGRRSGAFRAEAWAARARATAGDAVFAPAIDRAITYAEERGMPLLSADLRVCGAVVAQDPDGVLLAIDRLAEAPLARGRARVVCAELGGPADLDAALRELAHDGPWTARALRALGRRDGRDELIAEARDRVADWL